MGRLPTWQTSEIKSHECNYHQHEHTHTHVYTIDRLVWTRTMSDDPAQPQHGTNHLYLDCPPLPTMLST
jgi:hypothetical protein